MAASSLMSSKYWDIGKNHLDWHLWPNSRLSQKQKEFIDVFTTVHKTSNRHLQQLWLILKFMILDYLAAKKSGISA